MALQVTELKRKFILKRESGDVELDDINPLSTPQEICDMYSNTYPELVNSNVVSKGIENDEQVFHFTTITGTKG